jgi:hypothetical protein
MAELSKDEHLTVKKCADFQVTGKGDNPQWDQVSWHEMNLMDETDKEYTTRFKMLYSDQGIYVLGYCEDQTISTDYDTDQGDIWEGDVFEVFLQTDEDNPLYFEYEINPLNTELVILVPNNQGDFFGWAPWHYEGDRKVQKAIHIHGGVAETGAKVSGWTAEMFFPYTLFKALKNVPPKAGTKWKGNFYRMDYDSGERIKWGWKEVESTFHEYGKFGTIIFE